MYKNNINNQHLDYIIENTIRKTINESQYLNEFAPVAAIGGAALKMGGKALGKKAFNKIARKGIKTFGKKGMKNLTKTGSSVIKNIGAEAINNCLFKSKNNDENNKSQELIEAFKNFMQVYHSCKNSGLQINPKLEQILNKLEPMFSNNY